MKVIKQISIFSENRVGKIEKVTKTLSDKNVNILSITVTSMGDYGVLKILVDKPEEGFGALKSAGFTVTLNEVLGIEIEDTPGGLYKVVKYISENKVNVENAYTLTLDTRKSALFIIEVKDIELAKKVLEKYNR